MEVVILGAGESGVGAAILAKQKGHDVFVSDKGIIKDYYQRELEKHGIPFESQQHTENRILSAGLVIKSPGIPDHVALIKQLVSKGIPVISEIEFASRYTNGKIIGITGSNGKTTTTKLTYHLLKEAGIEVKMGGNVGKSFARCVAEGDSPYYVLELSSFQLDGIRDFRPDIALLLNISADHLDRYDYQMDKYVASKFRIAMNQQQQDKFLFYTEDEFIQNYMKQYSFNTKLLPLDNSEITPKGIQIQEHFFDLSQSRLIGNHNYRNALFAIKAALLWNADKEAIQRGINSFFPVEHRMEKIATIKGVDYINDSKATNVDAAYYALDAMQQTIVWIAGGQDKGNDYEVLKPLIKAKARVMICLGAENSKLIENFGKLVEEVREADTAEKAVALAETLALPGEAVLLSPACASFDLFDNYEQRGVFFKEAVLRRKK